jgi:hypothetical protein
MMAIPGAKVAYQRTLKLAPGTEEATRAAYELSHLEPAPVTKKTTRKNVVVPLRPREGKLGLAAPPGNWSKTA